METLYTLSDEYEQLMELAISTDPSDEQAFADTLEGLTAVINTKMDDYAVVMTHLKGRSEMIQAEIERLQAMKQAIDNHEKRMKATMLHVMTEKLNQRKIQTDFHTFTVCKNGGKQPMVVDPERVPDNYKRVVYETDLEKIRKELEDGKQLDFAHLEERGEHLRIK